MRKEMQARDNILISEGETAISGFTRRGAQCQLRAELFPYPGRTHVRLRSRKE